MQTTSYDKENQTKQPTAVYRVLSLDGGGVRGLYSAAYLDILSKTFAQKRNAKELDIGLGFDLIVGTSTGGIIACALAAGLPMTNVIRLYETNGASIFRRPVPKTLLGVACDVFFRPAALAEGTKVLTRVLEEEFREQTIGSVYSARGIALCISATELSQHKGWVFKTPHFSKSNHRDDHYRLSDICLATSAAPVYRSVASLERLNSQGGGGTNLFVDGGLWANNPVMIALTEALASTESGQRIEIFSLGTANPPPGESVKAHHLHRGINDWKFGADIATLSIDTQEYGFDAMARVISRNIDRDCVLMRFPSQPIPAALSPHLALDCTDEATRNALKTLARTDADLTSSICARANDPYGALINALFSKMPIR